MRCGSGGPATCCATLAASNELIPFWPVVLLGVTVYEPEPNPVSEYCPALAPGGAVVVVTLGDPAPVIVTFETNLGGVGPDTALPYVTVPEITAGGVGVAVLVAVLVGVSVAVAVAVFVGVDVGVGVNVSVAVGVGVAVFVAVDVGVVVGVEPVP